MHRPSRRAELHDAPQGDTPGSDYPTGYAERSPLSLLAFGFDDHAATGLAVHQDEQRRFEAQVADASVGFKRGLRAQPRPIDEPLAGIAVDGEVADLEGDQVLEEVAALRGGDAQVAEPALDDDARA